MPFIIPPWHGGVAEYDYLISPEVGMKPSLISQLQNGGIPYLIDEFCNDPNEVHALGLGILSIFDREPFDANMIPESYPQEVREAILKEYPYYRFGRVIGLGIAAVGVVVFAKFGIAPFF